jgi:hypothetical protein
LIVCTGVRLIDLGICLIDWLINRIGVCIDAHMGVYMGVYMGDRVDVCRAVCRAVCVDNYRAFLVY